MEFNKLFFENKMKRSTWLKSLNWCWVECDEIYAGVGVDAFVRGNVSNECDYFDFIICALVKPTKKNGLTQMSNRIRIDIFAVSMRYINTFTPPIIQSGNSIYLKYV